MNICVKNRLSTVYKFIIKIMKVLKFGGTSVGTPQRIMDVKKIVEQSQEKQIVVVSAFGGVTDMLLNIANLAIKGNKTYTEDLTKLKTRHLEAVEQLIAASKKAEVLAHVQTLLTDLENFANGIFLIRDMTAKSMDYMVSFGERLSSLIVANAITNGKHVDSRNLIKTDNHFGHASVDYDVTNQLLQTEFKDLKQVVVMAGFISSEASGETTTLGRGGSDFTAAIVAAALNATILEIWTDVDGFMTADPRKVKKAYPIDWLSYSEAMELSHFGAKVIYTPTVQPVYQKNIPIVIKNTFNPEAKGTIISDESHKDTNNKPIKGVSSIDSVTLITLQGSGLAGVTGTSMRLFRALAMAEVNVILISQASSEYSISFAVSPNDTEKASIAIHKEFDKEIDSQKVISLLIEKELAIIAIVGKHMKNTPGISGTLFKDLGKNGVNIIAIAQGSSELNISVVIEKNSLLKALNVIHEGFFLSDYVTLNLFQIGVGNVGGDLLRQIQQQQQKLLTEDKLNLRIAGLADLNNMIFDADGVDLTNYKETLKTGKKSNPQEFIKIMKDMNLRNSVFIDCTASKDIADHYLEILNNYISVVAANKIASSSAYQHYQELKNVSQHKGVKFLYETNVGAGLPVIKTINDLVKSGDTIVKLEAVLSGTLNFICNTISDKISLSQSVKMAQEKGYSEPDPRIDLGGVDVARKILILSRESGHKMEKEDVKIKSFLPDSCMLAPTMEGFWEELKKVDADFEKKRKALADVGKKWRFVAKLDNGEASIELKEVDTSHPFYYLEGSDNIVSITTARYKEQPMIIKGAGAGAAVTAAGIFADIIRIANI